VVDLPGQRTQPNEKQSSTQLRPNFPFLAPLGHHLDYDVGRRTIFGFNHRPTPIIMLMSASTALCKDRDSYLKLRNFSVVLSIGVTLLLLIFLIPPIFNLFVHTLVGLPDSIANLVHTTLLYLIPWPGAIGMRRFYQGLLIARHQTRRIVIATISRLLTMGGIALFCYTSSSLPGAVIGGVALAGGVAAETPLYP